MVYLIKCLSLYRQKKQGGENSTLRFLVRQFIVGNVFAEICEVLCTGCDRAVSGRIGTAGIGRRLGGTSKYADGLADNESLCDFVAILVGVLLGCKLAAYNNEGTSLNVARSVFSSLVPQLHVEKVCSKLLPILEDIVRDTKFSNGLAAVGLTEFGRYNSSAGDGKRVSEVHGLFLSGR